MDLHGVRLALADVVGGLDGWHGYECEPGTLRLPAAVVGNPTRILSLQTYEGTGPGGWRVELPVTLKVPVTDHRAASKRLDDALSDLIDNLAKAFGPWDDIALVEAGRYRPGEVGKTTTLDVDITVSLTL